MRWRLPFFLVLGLDVVLLAGWLIFARRHSVPTAAIADAPATLVKTNVVLRRQFFSWAEVESTDYPTYIANLRSIDCPEQTIRDIIIADVNSLYSKRLATELVTAEQQWWRSQPDSNVVRVASEKARSLDDERRALLTRLLGPSWETGDLLSLPRPSRPGVLLAGPILGTLPLETKLAVEEISLRSQERMQAYLTATGQSGGAADPAELARLRQQTRNELARVLSPQQLEEYLLRYSQNSTNLRAEMGTLKYFNATPEEFRGIFRATDTLDQQLQELAGNTDPNSVLQRRNLQQQRDNAIRIALGPERYQQYVLLHDAAYRDAYAAAEAAGTPEATDTIYQINQTVADQLAAIRANTNLTAAQRDIELKRIALDQAKANGQAAGQYVPEEQPPLPPTPETPEIVPPKTHPYVFSIGDTLTSVARRYNLSLAELQAANPNTDLSKIKPGDSILVPDALNR